jgi:hypothetical protein
MNKDTETAGDNISLTVKAKNTADSSSSGRCFIYTTICRHLTAK